MAKNTARAHVGTPILRVLIPMVLTAIVCPSSVANEWDFSANIFTGLTYTDNIGLDASGGMDDFIWELSPSAAASRDGKRVDIDFNYRLQGLMFARQDSRKQVNNYLQSSLQAEVVPDWIQFDANASISQTIVDPLLASGNTSINSGGNSTETMVVNVSPYILHSLGPATFFRAGVSAGIVEFDDAALVDSKQRNYFASLVNNGGGGLFNWSLGYNSSLVDYDLGQEVELVRINGEIGLRIGPRTEFVVAGGEDINDFGTLPGSSVAEGSFWNVGFRGGFGNNIAFDLRYGKQFFGDSYTVEFTRTSRALETSLSYSENATTIGAQQLNSASAGGLPNLTGSFLNQIDINGFDVSQREPELYIRRRLDFGNTVTTGKSTLSFALSYEDRSYIRTALAGARENVRRAQFMWNWNYDSATTVSTSATYQKLNSRDTVSKPQDFRLGLQVRKEIFGNSYVTARVSRNSRSAPQEIAEYKEHAFVIGFGRRF